MKKIILIILAFPLLTWAQVEEVTPSMAQRNPAVGGHGGGTARENDGAAALEVPLANFCNCESNQPHDNSTASALISENAALQGPTPLPAPATIPKPVNTNE